MSRSWWREVQALRMPDGRPVIWKDEGVPVTHGWYLFGIEVQVSDWYSSPDLKCLPTFTPRAFLERTTWQPAA